MAYDRGSPKALTEDPTTSPRNKIIRRVTWAGPRACGLRSRVCLLKRFERAFRAQQPLTLLQSACREQARRWSSGRRRPTPFAWGANPDRSLFSHFVLGGRPSPLTCHEQRSDGRLGAAVGQRSSSLEGTQMSL